MKREWKASLPTRKVSSEAPESIDRGLPSTAPEDARPIEDEPVATPLRSGKNVQHLCGLLLVAMVVSYGMYDAGAEGIDGERPLAGPSSDGH